jgi:hypothetical protein
MPYLEIDGQPVRLPADASVQVELRNPLMSDVLEESYAPELVIPTEGNETVLGHVHELALANRKTILEGAVLGHRGVPLHRGEVDTLGSTAAQVRGAFVLEGFLRRIKGITLPDALRSTVIDLVQGDEYILYDPPLYRDGGSLQFPQHSNPSLYPSDARPLWNPSAPEFATGTYGQGALITFTEYGTIKRTSVWVCVDPLGAGAGESPVTHPAKWSRTAYSLVNAWDKDTGRHYVNSEGAEFYCFVPWFYIKWVLTRALAHVGYTPVGEWMDDTAWDEWLLANTTTIDAAREQTTLNYFEATQNAAATYNGTLTDFKVPGHDESTAPNQDPDAVWDNSAMEWECPSAGTFTIKARTTFNRFISGTPGRTKRVRAKLYDEDGLVRGDQYLPTPFLSTPILADAIANGDLTRWVDFSFVCTGGDIGKKFFVIMYQVEEWSVLVSGGPDLPQSAVIWPTTSTDAYLNSYVKGWKENDTPTVMTPAQLVEVHRHMADVDLGGFIQAIKDEWNLEVTPDEATKTLRFDYREQVLANAPQNTTDHSARQVDEVELDHERATTGVTLQHDVETHEEDEDAVANASYAYSESDLSAPTTTGAYVVLKSTRELMKSVFREGVFLWEKVGYHVPKKTVGDEQEAEVRTMALVPLPMITQRLDGEEYLVPLLDAEGTSAWFNCEGQRDTLWIAEFKKSTSRDGSVTDVPSARCWGYGWDESDVSAATLLFDDADVAMRGLYQRCWRLWLAMLITAEPVKMDLRIDPAFLLGSEWKRILHIHSQRYLVETLPVDYGPQEELVSEKAQLLRMRSAIAPQSGAPPSLFTFHAVADGYMEIYSTSGWVTLVDEDGERTTWETADPPTGYIPIDLPASGWWRAFASDADGTAVGYITEILFYDVMVDEIDVRGLWNLLGLQAAMNPVHTVRVTGCGNLVNVNLGVCELTDVDTLFNDLNADLTGGTIFVQGGTNAAPTALSLAARTTAAANGRSILTN